MNRKKVSPDEVAQLRRVLGVQPDKADEKGLSYRDEVLLASILAGSSPITASATRRRAGASSSIPLALRLLV